MSAPADDADRLLGDALDLLRLRDGEDRRIARLELARRDHRAGACAPGNGPCVSVALARQIVAGEA